MIGSLSTLRQIKIKRPVVVISERDVEGMLEKLRKQRATWSRVKRGASPGDKIVVKWSGWIRDEKVIDSGKKPISFILGSNQVADRLQNAIIGSRAGDRSGVIIKHHMSDGNARLAGNRIKYVCEVIAVYEKNVPPLNKRFARSFGIKDGSLKKLRKLVRNILRDQIDDLVRREVREQLLNGLLQIYKAEASDDLDKKEVKILESQHLYPKKTHVEGEAANYDFEAQRNRSQVLSRIAENIIKENSIAVDQSKVEVAIDAIAAATENPEKTARRYHNNHQLFSKVEAAVLESQVLDFILEQAKVRDEPISYSRLCRDYATGESAETDVNYKQPAQPPIIELTPDKKCGFCVRSCCTYVTQKIPTPRTKEDFSHLLWQVSHEHVEAYKDNDGWHLMFKSRCQHLLPNGRCGNYEHRMQVCRKHSNKYCEFDAAAADGFELEFKDYDSLLNYCKQRFSRWEY
ncbi:MAG: FKBP-type peptidyl-prolyl cis-trans isomerase [Gammaproteobacteria bacterium]|jgi:trigger factor